MSDPAAPTPAATRRPGELPLPTREDGEVSLVETRPSNTKRLSSRTRERIRAMDVLYEADARDEDVLEVLAQRRSLTAAQTPLPARAIELVKMYADCAQEVDEHLATHSRDWPLHRMPAVDRAILRLGSAEIMRGTDPEHAGVIVGEYTSMARELSTEKSPRFVNALLQKIADLRGLVG